jgi:hypothetical protein
VTMRRGFPGRSDPVAGSERGGVSGSANRYLSGTSLAEWSKSRA